MKAPKFHGFQSFLIPDLLVLNTIAEEEREREEERIT